MRTSKPLRAARPRCGTRQVAGAVGVELEVDAGGGGPRSARGRRPACGGPAWRLAARHERRPAATGGSPGRGPGTTTSRSSKARREEGVVDLADPDRPAEQIRRRSGPRCGRAPARGRSWLCRKNQGRRRAGRPAGGAPRRRGAPPSAAPGRAPARRRRLGSAAERGPAGSLTRPLLRRLTRSGVPRRAARQAAPAQLAAQAVVEAAPAHLDQPHRGVAAGDAHACRGSRARSPPGRRASGRPPRAGSRSVTSIGPASGTTIGRSDRACGQMGVSTAHRQQRVEDRPAGREVVGGRAGRGGDDQAVGAEAGDQVAVHAQASAR